MKVSSGILMTLAALAAAPPARADLIIDLGGGWEATIFDEQNVSVITDFVSVEDDILVIQKFADILSLDPVTGQPKPVSIGFRQNRPDEETVSRIAITDELIFNGSGMDWTSYRNALLGDPATFDPVASADFTIDPFTTTTYTDADRLVIFSDGVVRDGEFWTPGKDLGELFINVDLSGDDPATFVLKESAVPGPGALALLALAGLAGRRRRRG